MTEHAGHAGTSSKFGHGWDLVCSRIALFLRPIQNLMTANFLAKGLMAWYIRCETRCRSRCPALFP